jgi:hypothetical protein
MLRPIGSLPPTVYWRRRLLVLAPIVLIAITIYVIVSAGGGGSKKVAGPSSPPAAPVTSHSSTAISSSAPAAPPTKAPTTPVTTPVTTPASTPAKTTASAAVVPKACVAAALSVAAATSAPSYAVGTTPTLYLQVTNIGKVPCIEDLSDSQIEMRVYNGASRVWGSHDCQIAPKTPAETLPINQPVRRSVVWTGLSSQPACAGTRMRVGAGTYTLHVLLAGVEGRTATFTLK